MNYRIRSDRIWAQGECEFSGQTAFEQLHTSTEADRAAFKHAARTPKWGGDQGSACEFD
jgi:xanthine dehydrogenase molybdopterin-binding subunit B